ncbi:MAG: hypothetical protein RJA70_2149 [Pseudomonadota bacterium]|jgi:23S rRNA pseudouridine2605 synthase
MVIPCRLVKFVRDATTLSIVNIHAAWDAGRLKLQAKSAPPAPVTLNTLVFEGDSVLLDGERLSRRTEHYAALLNKPMSVSCTVRDPDGKADLRPWLKQMPAGVFPVGRLDRDTTGLLLFSTDGDLSNVVLRPERHTDKTYWLWLNEQFSVDDPRLQALVDRNNPKYDGARHAEIFHLTEHYVELLLTLEQGKNRQIRRLCRALNLRLLHLHRKRIGPLTDEGLGLGQFRELSSDEVESLWEATGGRQSLRQSQLQALGGLAERLQHAGTPDARLEAWLSRAPDFG